MTVKMKYTNFFRDFRGKDEPYPNTIYIYNAPFHNGMYRGVYQGNGYVSLYHLDGTPVDGSIGTAVGGTINPTTGYHKFPVTAHTSERLLAKLHLPELGYYCWPVGQARQR